MKRVQADRTPSAERISVILPVLNEEQRVAVCLEGLIAQSEEVQEILVVDSGSIDATQAIVEYYRSKDRRVRWLDASPIDAHWTGKVWGLNFALQRSAPDCAWILCVDADVRVAPLLARSLLAHAKRIAVTTFSVATQQKLSGLVDGLIHPAMLSTLIYRFGSPGKATRRIHKVQANGQCFFTSRETLLGTDAFYNARASLCEDITIVRRLAECGERVGFYEAEPGLVDVRMYASWRDIWANWPRSLPMRDHYFGWREAAGLSGILLFQALPLPAFVLGIAVGAPLGFILLSAFLLALRVGVLLGSARAYPARPWTYWLSPLCDLPVTLRIIQFALRRRHSWRGHTYLRRKDGAFELLA